MLLKEKEGAVRFYVLLHDQRTDFPGLYVFDETQLPEVDGADYKPPSAPVCIVEQGETMPVPIHAGFCCLGGSLFLIGGLEHIINEYGRPSLARSKLLLSVEAAVSPPRLSVDGSKVYWTWTKLGSMEHERVLPKVFPHDGKIYIFGGCRTEHNWVEIFNPNTGEVLSGGDVPLLPDDIFTQPGPSSCFLWDTASSMGPRLMVCLWHFEGPSQLMSYNMQNNKWDIFDLSFPPCPPIAMDSSRFLIPYEDTLFLMDYADVWPVYNLSSRRVDGGIQVEGLKKYHDRRVAGAFCQPRSGGVLIFTIFMEGPAVYEGVAVEGMVYAKVRVECKGKTFAVEVEKVVIIDVGICADYSIVAHQTDNQTNKRSAVECPAAALGVKKDEKKMKLLDAAQ